MFCTQCGTELGAKDRYCPQCAHPTGVGGPPPFARSARLTRDIQNKKIGGVCAGFAHYLNVDVVLVRVLWLAIAIGTGVGFIAYLVAWIIMPKDQPPLSAPAGDYARQGV